MHSKITPLFITVFTVLTIFNGSNVNALDIDSQLMPWLRKPSRDFDISSLQVKITHVGPQDKPQNTIVIHSHLILPNFDELFKMKLNGFSLSNDKNPFIYNFSTTPKEMENLVEDIIYALDEKEIPIEENQFKVIALRASVNGASKGSIFTLSKETWMKLKRKLKVTFKYNNVAIHILNAAK